MPFAIQVHQHGGPEVLKYEEVAVGEVGADEVLVRQYAAGLNYVDVYNRSGFYPAAKLPFIPGAEGTGVVERVGARVTNLRVGDRIAYVARTGGAYAQYRVLPAAIAVRLPQEVSFEQAAAMMLKGMTARFLLRQTYPVNAGDTIVVHAAAGGVGLILCQWAAYLGATVIGTVGSPEKAILAREHGCAYTILYKEEDVAARVRELTDGAMVRVVYDSVGKATFEQSLKCLAPRGLLVSFGQSSGGIPPIDVGILARHGSLYLTRPTLFDYVNSPEELEENAAELFEAVVNGHVAVPVRRTFPLEQAAAAHTALEARETSGSTVLTIA